MSATLQLDAECRDAVAATCPRIMIVDDELTNIKVARRLLELEGYSQFTTTTDSRNAVNLTREMRPDLVLLDLMMPHVSGLDVLAAMKRERVLTRTPVIVLTAVTDRETRIEALTLGATDFLNKPIDPSELAARVRNILAMKAYQAQLEEHGRQLEEAVRERTKELLDSRRDALHCLARAAEFRDDDTGQHILRVGAYARIIARSMGLPSDWVDMLGQAAQLHDVGKIGVPDSVLLNPGKLSEEELTLMRKHAGFGKRILKTEGDRSSRAASHHSEIGAKILEVGASPLLEMARSIALTHHEWWDGSGYPLGLQGEDIPLEGRITAVADVFDALSTKRVYKDAFPLDICFDMMQEERGTHFDPEVLDAFVRQRSEIVAVQLRHAEEQ